MHGREPAICGRYASTKDMNQLGIEFGAQLRAGVREPAPNMDVRPTTQVLFLQGRLGEDGTVARELSVGRWGLIPTFAKTFESKFATFNAVSETALEKATFRNSVPRWRAAVPVSSYYEWKKSGPKRTDPKQRYEIAPANGDDSIAFAGLFAPWRNPAIEDETHPDAWLFSCTVLTMASPTAAPDRPALAQLAGLHDRLPVPLSPGNIDAWLDPRDKDGAGLLDLVRSEAYDVAADWALRPVELVKDEDGRHRLETVDNPVV
ncbi:SOS response-associated peptidase (plasmid) [Arthrobacter sp. KN11-1C]|uniref:SOS response-associated peptidase n=1 Tax=Arthrobacter sp. KN11-1C TaxID=3445774 RepID=UPI003F9EF9DD